jgi:outer membrane protein TolC
VNHRTRGIVVVALAIVGGTGGGCTSAPSDAGFSDVNGTTHERTGYATAWTRGADEDAQIRRATQKVLAGELTLDKAVRVALLNNRHLQASFEQLGIARGIFIQAGVPDNPVLSPEWRVDMEFEGLFAQDFISLLLIPLRRAVHGHEFEATKLLVTGEVIGLIGNVKRAYYSYQANKQLVEMLRQVAEATKSSYMAQARLREAGNATQLDVFRERAAYEEAKVQLNAAVETMVTSREQLNALMGLWGGQTAWETPARLAEVPAAEAEATRAAGDAAAHVASTRPMTRPMSAAPTPSVTTREAPPTMKGEDRPPAPAARAATGPGETPDEARAERLAGPPTDEEIAGPASQVHGAAEAGGPGAASVTVGGTIGPSVARYQAVERMAVGRNLELAARRNLIEAQAARVKLNTIREIFPFLDAGVTSQGDLQMHEWAFGPGLQVPVPLWDWAQGTYPAEMSRLRQLVEDYAAYATDVRAVARAAETRLQSTRARALYYRDVILPLHAAVVSESQMRYNAMQVTPFDLLLAKQAQITAGAQYIAALLEYWTARSELEQLLDGDLPALAVPQGIGGGAAPLGGMTGGQGRAGLGRMQDMLNVGGAGGRQQRDQQQGR